MERDEILCWLRETDEARLAELWRMADQTRQRHVGGEVHLRGLIEFSNYCVRLCAYCGLRAPNDGLVRYRMSREEIMGCVRQAAAFGYGTVVLQSGEDQGTTTDWLVGLVRQIKAETPLAVTLSVGERSDEDFRAWRAAGADRYLLRFETSNRTLYDRLHPPRPGKGDRSNLPERPDQPSVGARCSAQIGPVPFSQPRVAMLLRLRDLGYEIGSGVMIGIPGQTYDDLARDIELFAELQLDMIGVGPYLLHPNTPLGDPDFRPMILEGEQVPGDEVTTYKVIALARLACPRANIPSTTALATLNARSGRELGLVRGANVVMPNLTPPKYRVHYEIYPNKACIRETAEGCNACLTERIRSLGRELGSGRGDSPNYQRR